MAKVGTPAEPPEAEKPEPAVSVRRSVQPDHLLCLVCGKPQKILKRHLAVQHELTPPEYRSRFELRPDYPMIAPNYAQQRREVALKLGLGRPKKAAVKRKAPAKPRKAACGSRCRRPSRGLTGRSVVSQVLTRHGSSSSSASCRPLAVR